MTRAGGSDRPEPRWLGRLAVDEAHTRQIREHGGPHGLRDEHALEAAIARPRHRWAYEPEASLAALAASLGYGIVHGHPYIDGNKRVGLVAMVAFLDLNGATLMATDEEAVEAILGLAAGRMTEEDLTAWIEGHLSEGHLHS